MKTICRPTLGYSREAPVGSDPPDLKRAKEDHTSGNVTR